MWLGTPTGGPVGFVIVRVLSRSSLKRGAALFNAFRKQTEILLSKYRKTVKFVKYVVFALHAMRD